MTGIDLQTACEQGQELLMRLEYVRAEAVLAEAEKEAWAARDLDTLARLYMPLQEARRQRRQRCSEGMVCLDLIARGAGDVMDAERIVQKYPHGQLLVAGWGTIEPAKQVRRIQTQRGLYLETFLAAAYPIHDSRAIVIVPTEEVSLPPVDIGSIDRLIRCVPPHSVVLAESELPAGAQRGDSQTQERVMSMWERLHAPFLASADAQSDLMRRIEGYRQTLRVDYACELAHQKLSDTAREARRRMGA